MSELVFLEMTLSEKKRGADMKRIMMILIVIAGCTMTGFGAAADSIMLDGVTHGDVYIREGGNMYYVHFPESGDLLAVSKDMVTPNEMRISENAAHRDALLAQWRAARKSGEAEDRASPVYTPNNPASVSSQSIANPEVPNNPSVAVGPRPLRIRGNARAEQAAQGRGAFVSDGYLPYIQLNDIAMGDALKAILRGLNLDYRVEGNFIFISSPEKLRRETFEDLETRVYELNNAYPDTLPKIVVRGGPVSANPQIGGGYGRPGGGYGQQPWGGGYGGYGGGMGMGGPGMSGVYGMYGVGQMGGWGMPMGGGFGGMGMPMGGGFGGMGMPMGGPDVTMISNISDLFSNIDDRIVGEEPARIGAYGGTPIQGGAYGGALPRAQGRW